ncbi:MAG: flagellar filament capping protein FliD [SAR324 cluster bacterium]|nr:flagellar filament capping protein FliD [SAR324 cluster bacterium]
MTEINTTPQNSRPRRTSSADNRLTNARANSLQGLASGLDTQKIMDSIIKVEQRRLRPIETRRAETQVELDSFNLVKTNLESFQETSRTLAERAIWEGKLVESSDETVVKATATTGAKPGKNTIIVDRLALNHQIASQNYENPEVEVGTGTFKITVGEETTVNVVIDQTNNSLNGLKEAINNASKDVAATVINTGDKELPYQFVLTSQKTGSDGRITLEIDMKGGETPNFENAVDDPSDWTGVAPEDRAAAVAAVATGTGASTAIVRVLGDNTAIDDHEFTFTAIHTGIVGGENVLQLRWKDETGRSGVLDLDSFNYASGEPIEFADGLSLLISQGEIIVADEFGVRTRAEQSALVWWLSAEDRAGAFTQPTPWKRQGEFGEPIIEGAFTGEENQTYTLSVVGSGQIGAATDLSIRWESESGESGQVRVGRGYKPGAQVALTDGLTMALNQGVLSAGSVATFRVTAPFSTGKWWLPDSDRSVPSEILDITKFVPPDEEELEELGFVTEPDFPEELGPRKSTSEKTVTGTFTGDESKVYTFTATRDGSVGTTRDLTVRWEDNKGNSGSVAISEGYEIGTPLPFDSGLSISFGAGRVFGEDAFTLRTRTSTIQPAQDALIRLGATGFGGGLEITNSTNELNDVIEGVRLTLVSTGEKPVTITVSGDTEKAIETIKTFSDQYNDLALLINELIKFDTDTNEAGPLLGNSDLSQIRSDLGQQIVDPVQGLPRTLNMLFALGLQLDQKGLLKFNEEELRSEIAEDFGAVANVFRAKGESDNPGIVFINMTDDTLISPDGFDVDIAQLATVGSYETTQLVGPFTIDELNNSFLITVDGTASEEINLQPGNYNLQDYARELQNQITNDEIIGGRRVRVLVEGDRLVIRSGRHGSRSSIAFSGQGGLPVATPGLSGGTAQDGLDVRGTINGEEAEGLGQLLRGTAESKTIKGLRLLVELPESQLVPGAAEARVTITKGVASRLAQHIKRVLDPQVGTMQRITGGLASSLEDVDEQLQLMNDRIERKRERLQQRFAKLEGQMSKLKSQQNFLAGQVANLPKGGGGLPGL